MAIGSTLHRIGPVDTEVWKLPTEGGKEIQVTRNGGETAFESPDGKSIYYTKGYSIQTRGSLEDAAEWWGGESGSPVCGMGMLSLWSRKGSISFLGPPLRSLPSSF